MKQGFNIEEIEKIEEITHIHKHSYNSISVIIEKPHIPIELLGEIKNNCSEKCEVHSLSPGKKVSRITFTF